MLLVTIGRQTKITYDEIIEVVDFRLLHRCTNQPVFHSLVKYSHEFKKTHFVVGRNRCFEHDSIN